MNKHLRNGQISEDYWECKNCNTEKDHREKCIAGRNTPIIAPDVKRRKVQREAVTNLVPLE